MHPCLYVQASDRESIRAKIREETWAAQAWKKLLASVDPYVARTQADPRWAVSRFAMYWKEGERYTQCYVKKGRWDRGEGNAPVPTVRLPGMRVWNDYFNVPLEDRQPYNETGDMLARNRKQPAAPAVLVPYQQSGHLIRSNNNEILTLAEKAAFAYWITGDEKYAQFAAPLYWQWLIGTYYMKPPLDPEKTSGGPGGYEPGGIMGYYDYEQIHDDLMMHAAPIYDFLFPYLQKHPDPHLATLNKDLVALTGEVFKRFINIGFVRGGKNGNWNVNGWNVMMRGILALEPDGYYADRRGRDYYLKYYTTTSTPYHDALPDILKQYDAVTGLWPEAPGYGLGTINSLLDLALPISNAGIDTIGNNLVMQQAALAVFPWMDARGNIVVFGDTRGGPANFVTFERLLTYYHRRGDIRNATLAATAIRKGIEAGQYDRSAVGWEGICANQPLVKAGAVIPAPVVAYSPTHRHLMLRNRNDEASSLMFTLYGGYSKEKHLSPNGLALQLYGKGWALAPDAAAYESYWSEDYSYHSGATGSNTILPGYTAGPISVNALDPAPAPNAFTATETLSPFVSFADVSAGEKRRVVSIVRTSPTTGYYLDIFRSRQPNNDYLFHNVGSSLLVSDVSGQPLTQQAASLAPEPNQAYRFFQNVRRSDRGGDFQAFWNIDTVQPNLTMAMWMRGQKGRAIFQVDAPSSAINAAVSPGGASVSPRTTPALIVRQNGQDGWDAPFVAVFEPYATGEKSITEISSLAGISSLASDPDFVSLRIDSKLPGRSPGTRRDIILNATDPTRPHTVAGVTFQGLFGVVSREGTGTTDLYLGTGVLLSEGGATIRSADGQPVKARLYRDRSGWHYSSDRALLITQPGKREQLVPAAREAPLLR